MVFFDFLYFSIHSCFAWLILLFQYAVLCFLANKNMFFLWLFCGYVLIHCYFSLALEDNLFVDWVLFKGSFFEWIIVVVSILIIPYSMGCLTFCYEYRLKAFTVHGFSQMVRGISNIVIIMHKQLIWFVCMQDMRLQIWGILINQQSLFNRFYVSFYSFVEGLVKQFIYLSLPNIECYQC